MTETSDNQQPALVAESEYRDTPSGIPCIEPQTWHADAPTKPGMYWFYGEPWMGEMGGHYTGTVKPEMRLSPVEIVRLSNGLIGMVSGQFMRLTKWDGKSPGYLGKWTIAVLPDTTFKEATVVYS
jgi:hypothetical protein